MNAEVVERIWDLCRLGSTRSVGYGGRDDEHAPGSGYIFAYGRINAEGEASTAVHIRNARGEDRILEPATKENVLEALTQMGVNETNWSI
jgi:hypothetical protein